MRIFVYEHITGGGLLDQALPVSLAHEGDIMLNALLRDLVDIPGMEIITMRDPRLSALDFRITAHTPRTAEQTARIMERCIDIADAVWPIAPESGGVLERIHRSVLNRGRRLLGSHPDAVHLAASKRATSCHLESAGIAAVPTYSPAQAVLHDAVGQWVVKPDDGAGCGDTFLFQNLVTAQEWLKARPDNYVLQPFIPGSALSLCALCRAGEALLLSCNHQRIAVRNGRFHFLGSVVNALIDVDGAFAALADRVAAAIPGLWGYVGIDLVQCGSRHVVMEVNPRLTTSYAGLRQALGRNPAALVMNLMDDAKPFRVPKFARRRIEIDVEGMYA
ncbi:MAG TPA: ATP-grasp domain-containing protein [Burkholderiales bacterium]|nr:ATP-grasp domain-containing protein [Burkholderiales bacterium]